MRPEFRSQCYWGQSLVRELTSHKSMVEIFIIIIQYMSPIQPMLRVGAMEDLVPNFSSRPKGLTPDFGHPGHHTQATSNRVPCGGIITGQTKVRCIKYENLFHLRRFRV